MSWWERDIGWPGTCKMDSRKRLETTSLAAFVLARNTSRDGTLISVLVQIAAEAIGCDIIAENYGKFTPQTLQELVRGIDAAPAAGTAAASITFEKITFHDWFLNKIEELQRTTPGNEATDHGWHPKPGGRGRRS